MDSDHSDLLASLANLSLPNDGLTSTLRTYCNDACSVAVRISHHLPTLNSLQPRHKGLLLLLTDSSQLDRKGYGSLPNIDCTPSRSNLYSVLQDLHFTDRKTEFGIRETVVPKPTWFSFTLCLCDERLLIPHARGWLNFHRILFLLVLCLTNFVVVAMLFSL